MKPISCNAPNSFHRWSNSTSDEHLQPPPRTRHAAAVVDGALYVSGGTGNSGALNDLWRSKNTSTQSGWTLLAEGPGVPLFSSAGRMKPHAASVLVSPWGLLSVGGMVQGGGVGTVPGVWAIDPVSKLWRDVPIENGVASPPLGRWEMGAWHEGVLVGVVGNDAVSMLCGERLTMYEVKLLYEVGYILRELFLSSHTAITLMPRVFR